MAKVEDQPWQVAAENGLVLVDGPDGCAVTMTPKSALETSDQLGAAAVAALAQEKSD